MLWLLIKEDAKLLNDNINSYSLCENIILKLFFKEE